MKKGRIVCFGATGFLGEALVAREYGRNTITAVARNEKNLVALKNKYPDIRIISGDISDMHTVRLAMKNANVVYLFSAIKGVDIAENQPHECCKTNIMGVMNVIEASFEYSPDYIVLTSTDKAAQVSGVYGASKLIGEALFSEAQELNAKTEFRVVRYGNVLGSSGSFLTKWIPRMQQGLPVHITDKDMTRFFWTREEALDLVEKCLEESNDATPFTPEHMKSMRMGDILEACMQKYGRVDVEIIGNRGGENIHETMDGKTYSNQVEKFTIDEIKKII
jgi:UDP-N-acetylglucosamine 4,6-dehydratase/5-epimerase